MGQAIVTFRIAPSTVTNDPAQLGLFPAREAPPKTSATARLAAFCGARAQTERGKNAAPNAKGYGKKRGSEGERERASENVRE